MTNGSGVVLGIHSIGRLKRTGQMTKALSVFRGGLLDKKSDVQNVRREDPIPVRIKAVPDTNRELLDVYVPVGNFGSETIRVWTYRLLKRMSSADFDRWHRKQALLYF